MRLKKWMGIILSAAMLLALLTGCSSKSPAEADSGSKQSSESKEKTGGVSSHSYPEKRETPGREADHAGTDPASEPRGAETRGQAPWDPESRV